MTISTKFDHSGKRVFVSGSTSGIGRAMVLLFAASGALNTHPTSP